RYGFACSGRGISTPGARSSAGADLVILLSASSARGWTHCPARPEDREQLAATQPATSDTVSANRAAMRCPDGVVRVLPRPCGAGMVGSHGVVEGVAERGRARVDEAADVTASAIPVDAPAPGPLSAHRGHALREVGGRAWIGEKQILDSRADGAHPEIGPGLL